MADSSGPLTTSEKIGVVCLPFVVSFLFILGFRFISSRNFISYSLYGLASSLTNTTILFLFVFLNKKNRDNVVQQFGKYTIAVIVYLTVIVPFVIFFILISIIISGFRFPFNY